MSLLQIRPYRDGDADALWTVFYSAIHQTAAANYSPEQLNAWAPATPDMAIWEKRMGGIQPFVAEWDGKIAGYADLQPTGLIDHFFVASAFGRRGVGSALMAEIHRSAEHRQLSLLFSDVSLTARPFFEKWGFGVDQQQAVQIGTVALMNFRMSKSLVTNSDEKTSVFAFEDIVSLDRRFLEEVLRVADSDTLALALKGTADELRQFVFSALSKRTALWVEEQIEFLGAVRVSEVERARQEILNIIGCGLPPRFSKLRTEKRVPPERNDENRLTMEDIVWVVRPGDQTIVRSVDQATLVIALLGVSPGIRALFLNAMSVKMEQRIREEMENVPVAAWNAVLDAQAQIAAVMTSLWRSEKIRILEHSR